jgi:guanylate kinase
VQWLEVNPMRKRPIVFIGAPYLGRHEFRERLMNCDEFSTFIDVSIPHTTREQKSDEIDGRDYHFISRKQFEEDINNQLFVEYGEYEENLYGTSKSSIERCCQQRNRVTILNLLPEGLDALKYANLYPYVIYFQVPDKIEHLAKDFHFNDQQWNEIRHKSATIEKDYSHFFDRTFSLTDSFQSIFSQLKLLIVQVQHQSMWINQSWFSPQERF